MSSGPPIQPPGGQPPYGQPPQQPQYPQQPPAPQPQYPPQQYPQQQYPQQPMVPPPQQQPYAQPQYPPQQQYAQPQYPQQAAYGQGMPYAHQQYRRYPHLTACPRCGNAYIQEVKMTWWGGILGPRMMNLMKCPNCRLQFNAQTMQDASSAIMIYTVVGTVLAIIVGVACYFAFPHHY